MDNKLKQSTTWKRKKNVVTSIIFFRLFIFDQNLFPWSSAVQKYHSVKVSEEHLEYHPIILYHTMMKKCTRSIQVYDRES